MTNRTDFHAATIANRLAHALARVGFAVLGALCALFVAAFLGKADAFGTLLGSVLYAGAGAYLGIDIPGRRAIAADGSRTEQNDAVLLLSAIGTLLTAVAALIAVGSFILDAPLRDHGALAVGSAWLAGTTLQIVAGGVGRLLRAARPRLGQIASGDLRVPARVGVIGSRPQARS